MIIVSFSHLHTFFAFDKARAISIEVVQLLGHTVHIDLRIVFNNAHKTSSSAVLTSYI